MNEGAATDRVAWAGCFVVLLAALPTLASGLPQPFEGELFVSTLRRQGSQTSTAASRILISRWGARIEIARKARPSGDDVTTLLVRNTNPEEVLVLDSLGRVLRAMPNPGAKSAMSLPVLAVTRLKADKVAGYKCQHARIDLKGDRRPVEVWISDALAVDVRSVATDSPNVKAVRQLLQEAGMRGMLMRIAQRTPDGELFDQQVTRVRRKRLQQSLFVVEARAVKD